MLGLNVQRQLKCCFPLEPNSDDPGQLVAARLRHSGYPFLWGVSCRFSDEVLFLSGTVPTFHLKQMAQELAIHTPGITEVRNEVHVTDWHQPAARFNAAG